MIKVYHNEKAFDRDSNFQFMDNNELTQAMSNLQPRDLKEVARVTTDSLDYAYQLTNHIDRRWFENTEVKVIKESRSTSVGDAMQKDGKFYAVAPCGFVEFERIPSPPVADPTSICPVSKKKCEDYDDCDNRQYCHLK